MHTLELFFTRGIAFAVKITRHLSRFQNKHGCVTRKYLFGGRVSRAKEAELQEIFKPFNCQDKRDIQNVDIDRLIEDHKKKETIKSSTDRNMWNVQRW